VLKIYSKSFFALSCSKLTANGLAVSFVTDFGALSSQVTGAFDTS
jgi:hypothetical protein